jgi:hypothetical protein
VHYYKTDLQRRTCGRGWCQESWLWVHMVSDSMLAGCSEVHLPLTR